MKKGFTLAELLGVITILAVIAVIVFPLVNKTIKQNKEKLYNSQLEEIKSGAEKWAYANIEMLPVNDGETITVTLFELKKGGFLTLDIRNPITGELLPNDMNITITFKNNNYEIYVDGESGSDIDSEVNSNSPIIILNGNFIEYVEINGTYEEKGALAKDKDGNKIEDIQISYRLDGVEVPSIDTKEFNTYTAIYSAINGEYTSSITRTIVVRDTTAPDLVVPGTVELLPEELASFNLLEDVTVTDNSGEDIKIETRGFDRLPTDKIIEYTACDSHNNCVTKRRLVKVVMEDTALVGTPIIEKAKELVYENGSCKTDGSTYNYMGGCYIKGVSNNNYVWYSGFLWRIMGINADKTVRLITDENVTAIPLGAENIAENWDESYAKDWLNNYFYPRLKGNDVIKEQTWCNETTTNENSARTTCINNLSKTKSKIGLITLDEYNLMVDEDFYMNANYQTSTITPINNSEIWFVENGFSSFYVSATPSGLQPIINVKSDTIITEGNGIIGEFWSNEEGPYILNEDKSVKVIGKLSEKSTSGEYVLFAGKKYRVVDKDSNGNTKLILDGYYEENGQIFKTEYKDTDSNLFSTSYGIGQKLNTDVLEWLVKSSDTTDRNKLVTNYTWYQNNLNYGESYKISLKEIEADRSEVATVGLIRIGEILSNQSGSISTKGYTIKKDRSNVNSYWTITRSKYEDDLYSWNILESNFANSELMSFNSSLRPVIVIKSDVEIIDGTGLFSNPYRI